MKILLLSEQKYSFHPSGALYKVVKALQTTNEVLVSADFKNGAELFELISTLDCGVFEFDFQLFYPEMNSGGVNSLVVLARMAYEFKKPVLVINKYGTEPYSILERMFDSSEGLNQIFYYKNVSDVRKKIKERFFI